jgi:AcrR family transcriptional regulator
MEATPFVTECVSAKGVQGSGKASGSESGGYARAHCAGRAPGFQRTRLRHYFKSKKLLYREVVERTNEMVVLTSVQTAFEAPTLIGQLEGFINAAVGSDLDDRSAAAFLVTSVLESRRPPELRREDHDALLGTRQFLTWAVTGAIERGELSSETPVPLLVEVMTAMFWGMGFYAGFVGSHQELEMITEHFKKLLVGKLWDWKS